MKQLFLLVKLGLYNRLKWGELKNTKDKKKRNNFLLTLPVFVLVALVIAGYAAGMAYVLIFLEMSSLIPALAVTVTGLMTLFFTMLKTNGILFGYQDYEMLSALPIKTSTLAASRFLQLYFSNLLFSVLVMLPMGIVYGIAGSEGILFYVIWIIGIIVAPLIPTTLAILIGIFITAIASRMKHTNLISSILMIIVTVGILVGASALGSIKGEIDITKLSLSLSMLKDALEKLYPVSKLFAKMVRTKNLLDILWFVLISCGWYLIFAIFITLRYRRIVTALSAHETRKNRVALSYQKNTPEKALLKKEWRKFLNTSIYFTNIGMGVIMQVLITLAFVFIPIEKISDFFQSNGISMDLSKVIPLYLPFLLAGVSAMSCSTSCSLSLEGKSIGLLKALPLAPLEIYKGKIKMNLLFTLPVSLFSSLLVSVKLFMVGLSTSFIQILPLFLLPLLFDFFTAVWGMYINIRMPNFTWDSEIVVVKQSMASFLGILGGLLLAILLAILTGLMPARIQTIVLYGIMVLLIVIIEFLYEKIKKSPLPS